jgi:hypothetical protein
MTRILDCSLLLAAVPCAAQTPGIDDRLRDPVVQEAMAAITTWTSQARAANPDSWASASPRFRERIAGFRWLRWADEHVKQWEGVGAARVQAIEAVYTEPPEPHQEWVGVLLVHGRARGGKVYERVWAVRENDHPWAVVDYALWVDGAAIVTNAYVRPIPWIPESYGDRMVEGFYFLRNPR